MIETRYEPISGPGLSNFSFPEGTALIAIGDVHGQASTLRSLCQSIADLDLGGLRRHVVFLGDAIDRGPASVETMEIVYNELGDLTNADEVTLLPGNHELLMADAIDEARAGNVTVQAGLLWLMNGGVRVLAEALKEDSLATDILDDATRLMALAQRPADIKAAILPMAPLMGDFISGFRSVLHDRGIDPIQWIRSMPSHVRVGDVLCVHAGVDPKLSLEAALNTPQNEHVSVRDHWAWVREPFLANQHGWYEGGIRNTTGGERGAGVLVVHGHTVPNKWGAHPSTDPERIDRVFCRMKTNSRICVDFGSGVGVGVGACLITSQGRKLLFQPCEM